MRDATNHVALRGGVELLLEGSVLDDLIVGSNIICWSIHREQEDKVIVGIDILDDLVTNGERLLNSRTSQWNFGILENFLDVKRGLSLLIWGSVRH